MKTVTKFIKENWNDRQESYLSENFMVSCIMEQISRQEVLSRDIFDSIDLSEEELEEIADSITPVYYSEQLTWLKEVSDSFDFMDQALSESNYTEFNKLLIEGCYLWTKHQINRIYKEVLENYKDEIFFAYNDIKWDCFQLLQDSQDTKQLMQDFNIDPDVYDYQSFFVKINNGDYEEVYASECQIPTIYSEYIKIK